MEIDESEVVLPHLQQDCVHHIVKGLDCLQLSRVVPVSKTWKAAATSNQVWRPLYRLEFGPWTEAQEPNSWHQQFLSFKGCGAAHHASFCTKFASALEAVQRFRLVLTPPAAGEGPAPAVQPPIDPLPPGSFAIEPTSVFRTGQSVWIRFPLPPNPGITDLRLVADCGEEGEVALIVSPGFGVPAGDMQRMLMSHRTGLYAWTDTDEARPDEQGPPSWVVAYIHYEHLLRLWPLPLPQAFATALGPCAFRHNDGVGVQLFMDFSSIEDHACLGRLHTSLLRCRKQAQLEDREARVCVDFETGLSSDSVTLATQDRGNVPPQERGAVMDSILGGSCLVDFALLDANHHLLLGRAGVEVWNEEHQPANAYAPAVCTSWVRFLVDGVEGGMRENCIQIEPASCLLNITLCLRAAKMLGLANPLWKQRRDWWDGPQ